MKFLLVVAAVIAVGVASPIQRDLVTPVLAGPAPAPEPETVIISPAVVDSLWPVAVGPAIISPEMPAFGPAIIDFPLTETGELITVPAEASPAIVAPAATPSAPLVQIILNINQAESAVVAPAPVVVPEPVAVPEPIQIIDNWPVVAPAPVSPVEVVDVTPVEVVEPAPIAIAPVIIGTPIIPSPAVILPDELN